MKKKLCFGLACVSGMLMANTSSAQSSVTVYGLVDSYVGSSQLSGRKSAMVLGEGGMSSSNIGFKGSEDLGGNLKANFDLNGFFSSDTGSSGRFAGDVGGGVLFGRASRVGLSGDFGKIDIGSGSTPYFMSMIIFNPFVDSSGFSPIFLHTYTGGQFPISSPPLNGGSTAGGPDTRMNNMIQYDSPVFNGLRLSMQYGFGEVAGDTSKNRMSSAIFYNNGPLALTFAAERDTTSLSVNFAPGIAPNELRQTSYMGGITYDFGVAKLFGQYEQTTKIFDVPNGDYKYKTFQLGSSVPIGMGKILLSWARSKIDLPARVSPYTIVPGFATPPAGTATTGVNPVRNTVTLGYDYQMSKRTDLYAMYMRDQYTGLDSGNSLVFGMRHRF
jgi:predicted porin